LALLVQDIRTPANRATVRTHLVEVARRFPGGVPLLDPLEDMHIQTEEFKGLVAKAVSVQERIEKSPFHVAADKEERYKSYQRKLELNEEAKAFKREIKAAKVRALAEVGLLAALRHVLMCLFAEEPGDEGHVQENDPSVASVGSH
jgi:superfamily II RNA helicase